MSLLSHVLIRAFYRMSVEVSRKSQRNHVDFPNQTDNAAKDAIVSHSDHSHSHWHNFMAHKIEIIICRQSWMCLEKKTHTCSHAHNHAALNIYKLVLINQDVVNFSLIKCDKIVIFFTLYLHCR